MDEWTADSLACEVANRILQGTYNYYNTSDGIAVKEIYKLGSHIFLENNKPIGGD